MTIEMRYRCCGARYEVIFIICTGQGCLPQEPKQSGVETKIFCSSKDIAKSIKGRLDASKGILDECIYLTWTKHVKLNTSGQTARQNTIFHKILGWGVEKKGTV